MCTCGTTSASGQYHTSLVGPAVQHARRCPCHHFSSIPSTILTFAVQGRNLAATEPRHFGVADAVDDGADAACESHLVGSAVVVSRDMADVEEAANVWRRQSKPKRRVRREYRVGCNRMRGGWGLGEEGWGGLNR